MGQRPTILDVAKKAGVSKSTVSLVLQQSAAVKESTRVAVRQAMADIGRALLLSNGRRAVTDEEQEAFMQG